MFYAQLLEGHDLEQETIHQVLETEYEIPILSGHYRITAANAAAPALAVCMRVDFPCTRHQGKAKEP